MTNEAQYSSSPMSKIVGVVVVLLLVAMGFLALVSGSGIPAVSTGVDVRGTIDANIVASEGGWAEKSSGEIVDVPSEVYDGLGINDSYADSEKRFKIGNRWFNINRHSLNHLYHEAGKPFKNSNIKEAIKCLAAGTGEIIMGYHNSQLRRYDICKVVFPNPQNPKQMLTKYIIFAQSCGDDAWLLVTVMYGSNADRKDAMRSISNITQFNPASFTCGS